MAFMVNTDGTILADTAADAVALSELLRARTVAPVVRDAVVEGLTAEYSMTGPAIRATKPRPVKLAPPKVEGGKRRPMGTGSVYTPDKGKKWSWSLGGPGNRTVRHGFPTREAAEAALDAHLAGGSAPAVLPPPTSGVTSVKPVGEWGDADNGLQKHTVCNGSGKVDDPKKIRGKTRCHGCDGEGFRRAP